jgi:hypothetical protein
MNSEFPSISYNSLGDEGKDCLSPLCYLADSFRMGISTTFQAPEKFAFLLNKGADVYFQDENGNTCLHLVLTYDKICASQLTGSGVYNEQEFKTILMAMIAAGADIEAFNNFGQTPSDVACLYDHEEIWIQVLAACGYDPWEVFSLENEWLRRYSGTNIFPAMPATLWPMLFGFRGEFTYGDSIGLEDNLTDNEDWNKKIRAEIQVIYGDNDDECSNEDQAFDTSHHKFPIWDIYSAEDCEDSVQHNVWNPEEDDEYVPINGDPQWLAYTPRHRFLWYWVKTNYPADSESECWESFHESEDEDEEELGRSE